MAKILDLVENSSSQEGKGGALHHQISPGTTPPLWCCAALALAVLPPLVGLGAWRTWTGTGFHRALIFLVISCPCALVISVPLSFFGGIGGASRHGILVKGGNYLEVLAHTEMVVFDKTGTLTRGVFTVTAIHPLTGDGRGGTAAGAGGPGRAAGLTTPSPGPIREAYAAHRPRPPGDRDVEELAAGTGVRPRWTACPSAQRQADGRHRRHLAPPCHPGTIVHVTVDGASLRRAHRHLRPGEGGAPKMAAIARR